MLGIIIPAAVLLVVYSGLIYGAVLLATIGPAVQASRMRTSEALRIVG